MMIRRAETHPILDQFSAWPSSVGLRFLNMGTGKACQMGPSGSVSIYLFQPEWIVEFVW